MKTKHLLSIALITSFLTGCALPTQQSTDYSAACPSYDFSAKDKGKTVYVQRVSNFFITSNGSIYSKREIDIMNTPQNKILNNITGLNSNVDISTTKEFKAIQYRIVESGEVFCGSDDVNDNQIYNGEKLAITDVRSNITSSDFLKNGNSTSTGFTLKPIN